QHDVHRDPMEPGRELRVAPELRKRPPRANEDILRQLLGRGRIPLQPEAECVHPGGVRVVQRAEGRRIGRPGGREEVAHGNPGCSLAGGKRWRLQGEGGGHPDTTMSGAARRLTQNRGQATGGKGQGGDKTRGWKWREGGASCPVPLATPLALVAFP